MTTHTTPRRLFTALLPALAMLMTFGCDNGSDAPAGASALPAGEPPAKTVTIGLVAKSQSNAVFQVAYAGALAAAEELGPEYGVNVEIDWQTPPDEDAQRQAQAVEQLARAGAQGIAVACSDANTLTPAIDKAVELGAAVICFDSDAPQSQRFAYYGTDDIDAGTRVMKELAEVMNQSGQVAILAGNQSAPNLQKRKDGVTQTLANYENMSLIDDGVFYHEETPEGAATAMNQAQSTNPQIGGWALIGGWPLFTSNALRWEPGSVKVVSVDALPPMIDYLESGHVQVLLAQDCYGWGYEPVRLLLDKIVRDTSPETERVIAPLTRVTRENADDYRAKWAKWTK